MGKIDYQERVLAYQCTTTNFFINIFFIAWPRLKFGRLLKMAPIHTFTHSSTDTGPVPRRAATEPQ